MTERPQRTPLQEPLGSLSVSTTKASPKLQLPIPDFERWRVPAGRTLEREPDGEDPEGK
jgi:hypothetical protein